MENINHKGNVVEIMSSWTQTNDDNDNNKIKNKLNSKIKIDILFKVKNTFCCCQSFKVFFASNIRASTTSISAFNFFFQYNFDVLCGKYKLN